jgi:hypothetical protein
MRMNAEKRGKIKSKLNKRLVRQTLKGYARADKSIQQERHAWLAQLTAEEARRIFDELHQDADKWKQFGGDLKALEERRTASKIRGRRIFMRLYRRSIK